MEPVIIAGVGMIPFTKPGASDSYDVMGARAVKAALAHAGLDYPKIQMAYASYVYGDSCSGQAALYHVGMTGIPIVNVNNMCSSGSSAFAMATQAIRTGMADCVLAVGFEQMVPGALDSIFPDRPGPQQRHIDLVARVMKLTPDERKIPPALQVFGSQVDLLRTHYGVSDRALARVTVKAHRHAQNSPFAIFKNPLTEEDVIASPDLLRGLRKLHACPPSCGAASVIICSPAFAKKHGIRDDVRLAGQGWVSDRADSFGDDLLDTTFVGLTKDAAHRAYEEAAVDPREVDVIELHDCFSSNEIISYYGLGLCALDDAERFVMDDQNTYGGTFVVNPSGGLLSKGHPLGATGLAQITELTWQLRGEAQKRQVENARIALQHNVGLGSAAFVNILKKL